MEIYASILFSRIFKKPWTVTMKTEVCIVRGYVCHFPFFIQVTHTLTSCCLLALPGFVTVQVLFYGIAEISVTLPGGVFKSGNIVFLLCVLLCSEMCYMNCISSKYLMTAAFFEDSYTGDRHNTDTASLGTL